MKILRHNFPLKLLSFLIAVTGWAFFRYTNNPLLASQYDQQLSVPIVAINLPPDEVAEFSDKNAVVTVRANRDATPIKPDQVKAVLNLAGLSSGVQNVPITLVAPNIAVQSLSPGSVTLRIERIERRLASPLIHYTGTPRNGVVVSKIAADPASVTLQGTSGVLAQVAGVRVDVPLPQSPGTTDSMRRVVPVDVIGRTVPGVSVTPDLILIRVTAVAGEGPQR